MEKFKIYVHHNYSYERFWYFFHGVDVDINDVVTHVDYNTAFNKKIPIEEKITIPIVYKNKKLEVIFAGDSDWNESGHHIFDYSIYLYDIKMASDRGFNSNIMNIIDNIVIPKLNKASSNRNSKVHFIYIDWEGHNPFQYHRLDTKLNKEINVYVDENDELYSYPNSFYPFTLNFMSFIYPNTLGLREYIFFADLIKDKKDYKHKINYPIRRLYKKKLFMVAKVKELKNINITHSSFHNTKQYSNDQVGGYRRELIKIIGEENIIDKRGYGLYDFGGEWNDDNLREFLWKMFNIAEVNILPEYYWGMNLDDPDLKTVDLKSISTHYFTEKSITHILAGKPFIPFYKNTIDFYDNILIEKGYTPAEYPLDYTEIDEKLEWINDCANNDGEWEIFRTNLQTWVNTTRDSILDMVTKQNDLLDVVLEENNMKNTVNIL